jgi:hypothetical protein
MSSLPGFNPETVVAGYEAYWGGMKLSDNPCVRLYDQEAWKAGWLDAQKEEDLIYTNSM